MKTKLYTLFVITTVIFLFSCVSSNSEISKENISDDMKKELFQCLMKCEGEKLYEDYIVCPICKMDLELVSQSEHE